MITEKHLTHILKEMDYALLLIAKEITKEGFPNVGTLDEKQTVKYLEQKVALLKFHVDWIRVDMEDDGA